MELVIEPYRIDISDDALATCTSALHEPGSPSRSTVSGGTTAWSSATSRELVDYWRDTYDWRRAEARLNRHPHFVTEIDGTRVHFMHVRSPEPDALPLVITHGWPGSIVEFLDIVGPLSDPRAHGGDPSDAFHVVCPSIPGYAFSGPTNDRGWDPRRVGSAFAQLMAALGYERYGAQGGDWGSMISSQLGAVDAEHVVGVHLNMVVAGPPPDTDFEKLADDERDALASLEHYRRDESGYASIQGTRPQTIGYSLDDSPVGLAAWIVEKFRAWSDCDGDVERSFTKDQLLDNVMLYWLTATAHSAARLYYEVQHGGSARPDSLEVPVGVAAFPREVLRTPRRWAETSFNIVRWTDMPRGGHFAAFEVPELLLGEIRAFFAPLR